MSLRQNNEYLRTLWLVVLIVVVLAILVAVTSGRSMSDPITLVSFGAGLVFSGAVHVWNTLGRIPRLFRQADPAALIRATRMRGVPNAAAWSAYFEAWAYAVYGRFTSARAALDKVDWRAQPPLLRAAAMSVQALLCFLDTEDFARGLELARTALADAAAAKSFPGVKTPSPLTVPSSRSAKSSPERRPDKKPPGSKSTRGRCPSEAA